MVEGRVYTRDTLTECAAMTTARSALTQSYQPYRLRHVLRAPARAAPWRRAPLRGPPPWPPSVSTSAARRPIALRREPTSCVRDVESMNVYDAHRSSVIPKLRAAR